MPSVGVSSTALATSVASARVALQRFSDILNQLTVMYNAGDAADLAQASGVHVPSLQMMGALAPAEDLFPADFLSDLYEPLYELLEFDGKHWGIPWGGAQFGFLYNRDLMEQAGLDPNDPPETFTEFQDAVRTARENLPSDVVIMGIDTSLRVFGFEHNYPFILGSGAEPFATEVPQFDTPEVRNYLSWVREAAENNYVLPGKKLGEFRPLAAQGRLLFMFDQQHIKGTVRSINPDISVEDFNETWGLAPMPANPEGEHQTSSGDHQLIIFSDSPHQEEAALFAQYLVDSDYALENYIQYMGMTPATESGVERFPAFTEDPILNGFIEKIIPITVPMPYGPKYSEYALAFMAGVQEAMTSNKSIDEISASMQAQVENVR